MQVFCFCFCFFSFLLQEDYNETYELFPISTGKSKAALAHPDDGAFGNLKVNQSSYQSERKWTKIENLDGSLNGMQVWIRGRVDRQSMNTTGERIILLVRNGLNKVQASLHKSKEVSSKMMEYARKIPQESLIDINGTIQSVGTRITTATQQNIEILVKRIYAVSLVAACPSPFDIEESEEKNSIEVEKNGRLVHRCMDLRTPANHSIFRILGGVCQFYRDYLLGQGFIEIHSPNGKTFSGETHVYKQMALCCDLGKVFEIGSSFGKEKVGEFTSMDMGMEIKEHYNEVLEVTSNLFIYIFEELKKHFSKEIELVRKEYPFENLIYGKNILTLTYEQARDMIKEYYNKLYPK